MSVEYGANIIYGYKQEDLRENVSIEDLDSLIEDYGYSADLYTGNGDRVFGICTDFASVGEARKVNGLDYNIQIQKMIENIRPFLKDSTLNPSLYLMCRVF